MSAAETPNIDTLHNALIHLTMAVEQITFRMQYRHQREEVEAELDKARRLLGMPPRPKPYEGRSLYDRYVDP